MQEELRRAVPAEIRASIGTQLSRTFGASGGLSDSPTPAKAVRDSPRRSVIPIKARAGRISNAAQGDVGAAFTGGVKHDSARFQGPNLAK